MRVQQSATARPVPIDRNAVPVPISVDTAPTAPHSETSRFLYTLPSGKKGMLEFLQLRVIRSASTPNYGRAAMYVKVAADSTTYQIARCELRAGAVDAFETVRFSGVSLPERATLQITTLDTSEGGTCEYLALGSLLQYDA